MISPPKNGEAGTSSISRRVLVVEDDPASLSYLQFALAKHGYAVVSAEDAASAREQLAPACIRTFDCVVTDYRMPDQSGLDLLAWIKGRDPALATIIVTAEGERGLIAESLRGGAVDFLDKPIDTEKLFAAVTRAVQQTWRQRHLADSESSVRELGRAQERMLGGEAARSPLRADVCFHPKHEAGGDFFSRFRPAPDKHFYMLTDVSGHDLQAAYISAYFQGVVRGMLEHEASMEEIFVSFNRLLLEEWNQVGEFGPQSSGIEASIAASAVLIDTTAQTATVLAHGMPAPVFWLPDGDAQLVGDSGGFPLGWFSNFSACGVVHPIPGGGSFCLWTDGLEDAAGKKGVSELSLAWALQRAKICGTKFAEIDFAADDILLADIYFSSSLSAPESFRPLILDQYHGGQSGEIDELQSIWRRSLQLVVPELPEARLHDVLLSSREVLLNALLHGCGSRADQKASFQAAYCPSLQTIRVRVCDPGPGHQFNLTVHEERAARELAEDHRGLILVRHLADNMSFRRNGASVTMDFNW